MQELAGAKECQDARHNASRQVQAAVGPVGQHEIAAGGAQQPTEGFQGPYADIVLPPQCAV